MNINSQTFLPAPPDQIASLTLIELQGATLKSRFESSVHDYRGIVTGHGPVTISATPTSSHLQSLTIHGSAVAPGVPHEVTFTGRTETVPIVVTAHDGKTAQTYNVILSR